MSNLEAVVTKMKRDIELNYVYVMMKPNDLQTLLDGMKELEKQVAFKEGELETAYNAYEKLQKEFEQLDADAAGDYEKLKSLQREIDEKDDAISYAMNQIQIKESHIRKMEASREAS